MFIAISTHPVRTKYKAKSYQSAALRTTSFIYSLYGSSIYIRTMHTGEGKTKNPGWPASRISYLTSIFPSIPLTIQEQRKSVERELHFHRTAETKFLDNITIRSTESAPFILCCPIAIPKFQTILRDSLASSTLDASNVTSLPSR